MLEKSTVFESFNELEKSLINSDECHLILHVEIEKNERNNFSLTSILIEFVL
jgi:hypothetical protein